MADNFNSLIDHYFREEYGKVVSFLTSKYGTQHLELVEDSVQEALIKAVQTWPYAKAPSNPSGWIVKVASNKMIDHFRKASRVDSAEVIPDKPADATEIDLESIKDDVVKMMFACCHPTLSTEHQIILILKILGGLSVKEISRALLKKEETIAKSYTRAKAKFQKENIRLELPSASEIKSRLNTVLKVIYLLFNEGYKSTLGDDLVKRELCDEAIRLNAILLDNDDCNISMTNALMALMYFHSARFEARVDGDGKLVTLEFQNRGKWNTASIDKGKVYLQEATRGAFMNEFYIQATISGLHCEAKTYDETNWSEILELYDLMIRLNPSPIIKLNRVVAESKVKSPAEALESLELLASNDQLTGHYLFHAIKGDLLIDTGKVKAGREATLKAMSLTNNSAEKEYLRSKIEEEP
ncbi:MAG: sigma-70 family RNA polymerase sigma factor [Cyclobacteriaceae bacterium]